MSFLYAEYLPLVFVFVVLLGWGMLRVKKQFWKYAELYWGKRPSFIQNISLFLFLMGLLLVGLALLDFRGPEHMVDARKQEKSMVILIDNSQSMLCEDVRPNRMNKAVMLARHLVKNSFQTKIAVMLFSEVTRKLVPFTSDRDLIDARLMSLQERNDLPSGGTRLKQAIREALQELFTHSGDQGNIVIISDAEGWDESFSLSISKNVNVAFIAVGTAKGGPIPLRDKRGRFIDHKREGSEIVNTALDEKFLKGLSSDIPNYRYWITSSYSLPTEEVLGFLNQNAKLSDQKSLARNRDSYFDYFLISGVVLLIVSLLIKRFFKSYVVMTSLFLPILLVGGMSSYSLISNGSNAYAQNAPQTTTPTPKPKPTFSPKTKEYFELWKKGNLNEKEKKDLAMDLLKTGFPKLALSLYLEIQGKRELNGELVDIWNNGAIAKSQGGDAKGGIKKLMELQEYLEKVLLSLSEMKKTELVAPVEKIQSLVRQNILALTIQQQQQQQQKQQQEQNDQEKQDQEEQNDNKDQSDQNQKQDQSQDQKQDQNQDQKDEKQDQKDQKDEKKDENKNQKDQKEKSEEEKKKEEKEKEKENEKNNEPKNEPKDEPTEDSKAKQMSAEDYKKLPAILKQLMNEDRDLQKQLIDTTTKEKGVGYEKDW
ncbi:MAG: VWA domain-containing protein [Bacteriovoracaceae bacterium]|nr:VWA domain-containing protein [Bacteriovoracaceae bacterium]